LRLPHPALEVHAIRDGILLIKEGDRYRYIIDGSPETRSETLIRTVPRQSSLGVFERVTPAGDLLFRSGASREEIDMRALASATFRSEYTAPGASTTRVQEPAMTPATRLFWNPSRPPEWLRPGHGKRSELITAFSIPRPSERIEEYEPFTCDYPPHVTQDKRRLNVWVPARTQIYQHTLRDRQGHTQIFFTALESGEVTYASESEAATRGCEASYLRTRQNGAQSLDPDRPLRGKHVDRLRVELRDLGVPAAGVIVRIHEEWDTSRESCGESGFEPGSAPDITPEDGMTLADGSYVWKRERLDHSHSSRRIKLRDYSVDRTLCIRLDGTWRPIWYAWRDHGNWSVRCDLARPAAHRCRRIE